MSQLILLLIVAVPGVQIVGTGGKGGGGLGRALSLMPPLIFFSITIFFTCAPLPESLGQTTQYWLLSALKEIWKPSGISNNNNNNNNNSNSNNGSNHAFHMHLNHNVYVLHGLTLRPAICE